MIPNCTIAPSDWRLSRLAAGVAGFVAPFGQRLDSDQDCRETIPARRSCGRGGRAACDSRRGSSSTVAGSKRPSSSRSAIEQRRQARRAGGKQVGVGRLAGGIGSPGGNGQGAAGGRSQCGGLLQHGLNQVVGQAAERLRRELVGHALRLARDARRRAASALSNAPACWNKRRICANTAGVASPSATSCSSSPAIVVLQALRARAPTARSAGRPARRRRASAC